MNNIKIAGVGAYSPSLVVTNDDISKLVETNDEWIQERTGIKERRISEGEDTSDFAVKSAMMALEKANIKSEELELIIVATVSPDNFIPSVACLVQSKLNARKAACFDINVACSGFLYGLEIAKSMMKSMNYKNALVIGSETLSKLIDWTDRGTCILFGDGGGAAALTRCEKGGILKSYLRSDGSRGEALTIEAADFKTPFTKEKKEKDRVIKMNGREVFKFATTAIADGVTEILKGTNLTLDDIKYIVPHQANYRIIHSAAKKLNIEIEKFYINLDRYGNTSSASVPLALNEMMEEGLINEGDKIVFVAFGGGLTHAATLVEF